MIDFIYVYVCTGDNGSLKNGHIIDYSDPDIYDPIFSDHMKKNFCILKMNKVKFKNRILAVIKEKGKFGQVGYKKRSGILNLATLETRTGIANLKSDLENKGKAVEIIDATNLLVSDIKDT